MGLQRRVERIALDVSSDYTGGAIWAVQGERNSLELDIELGQAGKLIDLSGTNTAFRFCTPHGYRGDEHMGTDTCYAQEGTIGHLRVIVPMAVFSESGETICAIDIDDTIAGITVKTPPFKIHVLPSI